MNTLTTWLPIAAPLACAFWVACVASKDTGLLRFVGLLAPVLSLAAAALAWRDFDTSATGLQFGFDLPWSTFPGLTMGFGIDAISFPLLVAGALVTAAAVLLVEGDDKESPTQVALLLLTFAAIFLGLGHFAELPLMQRMLDGLHLDQPPVLFAGGIVASQLISNVPATVLLLDRSPDAVALAVAVNVGGFGVAIGSLANLIALRLARQPHGLRQLHRVSIPFLLVCAPLVYLVSRCL